MSTYGQFYNPKQPDNRLIYLIIGLVFFGLLSMLFFGCNSVKKATDIKISKVDSSTVQKVDSSFKIKNDIRTNFESFKTWDKESVIEFWPWANGKVGITVNDSINLAYADHMGTVTPYITVGDEQITILNKPIKSITTRSKGKYSSSTKKVDKTESTAEVKKEAKSDLKTYDKEKTKNKDSERISPVLIAFALLLAAVIGFVIAHKLRP